MKSKSVGVAKMVALAVVPLGLAVVVAKVGQQRKAEAIRSGRYQFAYEEKGVTVRQETILDLSADGQWVMDSPRLRESASHSHLMWTPPHGTHLIDGDTITFQEVVSPGDYNGGPGRPSAIKTGRFQGKDLYIVSLAEGIVFSESAHNPRYEKQP